MAAWARIWSVPVIWTLMAVVDSRAVDPGQLSSWSPAPTVPGHLEWFLMEELPANMLIGNVAIDTGLEEKYNESVFKSLRYGFVNHGSERQQKFAINDTTGVIETKEQIDREVMCGQENPCLLWLHVAVTPEIFGQVVDILVEVVDKNDHSPKFNPAQVNLIIPETAISGSKYELPSPHDPDSGKNGINHIELIGGNGNFDLDVTNVGGDGPHIDLVVKETLDREEVPQYRLRVVAHDEGSPSKSGSLVVNIKIQDVNDNDPKFDNATYEVFVNENLPAGTTVAKVYANDQDEGPNGQVVYNFDPNTEEMLGGMFGVDNTTGAVFVKTVLDFELGSTYLLGVTAHDLGPQSQPAHATVVVRVEDTNDNAPKVTISTASGRQGHARVDEGQPPGVQVANVMVTDQDGGENGKVQCSLTHPKFALSRVFSTQYQIVTSAELNREVEDQFDLIVRCQDNADPPQVTMESLVVEVNDINDHSPTFSKPSYQVFLQEASTVGTSVLRLNASDLDLGQNAEIRYSLSGEGASKFFQIDSVTGAITLSSPIDSAPEIKFQVTAQDQGNPSRSTSTTVTVVVVSSEDQLPRFTLPGYAFGVFENELPGTEVGRVEMDEASRNRFGILELVLAASSSKDSQSFSIDPRSGKLVTQTLLDRERQPVYYLTVLARPSKGSTHTGTVSVTVYVADRNDNKPVITHPRRENTTLFLNNNAPVGYLVTEIKAKDGDIGDNGKLTYYLSKGNDNKIFELEPSNGQLKVASALDNTRQHTFNLMVVVRDHGFPHQNAVLSLQVVINKSVEYRPAFREDILSSEHATLVVSITAAALITVFVVCFAILVYLVWRRTVRKKQADKYSYSNVTPPGLNCLQRTQHPPPGGADPDPEAVRSNTVNLDLEQSVYPAPWCQKTLNTECPVSPVCSPQYPEATASLAISNSHLVLEGRSKDPDYCQPDAERCKSDLDSHSPPGSPKGSGSDISLISGPGVSDV